MELEKEIYKIINDSINELLDISKNKSGILVVGCSTSRVTGNYYGKNSSDEIAKYIYESIKVSLKNTNIELAIQCCEHLNRALVVERKLVDNDDNIVFAVPVKNAGGSLATYAYNNMSDPVLVEKIQADFGIDIGNTLIGMHLKRVVVPVAFKNDKLIKANIIGAYTRPRLIGGERAQYSK